ncbi:mucin-binding protein [Ligilactobacillus aviarius]|uniref:mucin-binding protein n=1 Tax=Ligilactobacillus aviarius TaxID=1606 RepID=UPI00249ECA8A|nr:MucBP domain-containing protein [Ligilactobacillus aviarius]
MPQASIESAKISSQRLVSENSKASIQIQSSSQLEKIKVQSETEKSATTEVPSSSVKPNSSLQQSSSLVSAASSLAVSSQSSKSSSSHMSSSAISSSKASISLNSKESSQVESSKSSSEVTSSLSFKASQSSTKQNSMTGSTPSATPLVDGEKGTLSNGPEFPSAVKTTVNDGQRLSEINPIIKNHDENENATFAATNKLYDISSTYVGDITLSPEDAQNIDMDDLDARWYIKYETNDGQLINDVITSEDRWDNGEIYYPYEAGSSVRTDTESGVNYLSKNGYSLDQVEINYFINPWNQQVTVTLYFDHSRIAGKPVNVVYQTADGKVLGTGTASYENSSGTAESTPYVGDTYTTTAKTFTGYQLTNTPSNATGTVTDSAQTVTYTYAPIQEKVNVQIIDDTTHQTIKTVTVNGSFGQTVSETTNDILQKNLTNAANYNVVSSTWPSSLTFNTSNNGATYTIHVSHKTKSATVTANVTQTIHYVYSGSSKQAQPDHTAQITFQATETVDEVTGQIISQTPWKNMSGTDEFPSIQSPEIVGYTPSYTASQAITGVTANTPNNVQTITYTPNNYVMTITFYDMDAKRIIQQKVLEGAYGTTANFDYQSVIDQLESQGYKVARNNIPSKGLVFNNTGKQNYEVDFTHTSTVLPSDAKGLTKVIERTIHYVYADGKTAHADDVQTVTYTRTATEDNVTHEITYGTWTAANNNSTFAEVKSPTISGYTPSIATVAAENVSGNAENSVVTVVYTPDNGGTQTPQSDTKTTVTQTIYFLKNDGTQLLQPKVTTITFTRTKNADGTYTAWKAEGSDDFPAYTAPTISGYEPNIKATQAVNNVQATDANNVQTIIYSPIEADAEVVFYDQTTGKNINVVNLNGDFGTSSSYSPATEISTLESMGYKLVSSDFPKDGISFEETGSQQYTIVFAHTIVPVTQTSTVTQTIKYEYSNGTQAADPVTRSLTFTRTGTLDKVTNQATYGEWKPQTTNTFSAVKSPVIYGYTTSHPESTAVTVDGSSPENVQVITYIPNTETATITFTDQTTGQTINKVTVQGDFGTNADYSPDAEIAALEKQGYELVSNNFKPITFDKDSKSPIVNYQVVLKEQIVNSTESKTITQTIHYVDQNGKTLAADHTATITFTRPVTTNKVTSATTYGNWTPSSSDFPAVASPTIMGYTPDKTESTAVTVSAPTATTTPQNDVQTITYTPKQETIKIEYIDAFDPNNPTTPNYNSTDVLSTTTLTGAYGSEAIYSPTSTVTEYHNKGYEPVGFHPALPEKGLWFNVDGTQVYKFYLIHQTKQVTQTAHVKYTVRYELGQEPSDGSTINLPADNVQDFTFTRDNTVDEVTGKVLSNGKWNVDSQQTKAVTSPTIAGYTADPTVVASQTITPNADGTDSSITKDVIYTPNQESAKIEYYDQTTGKVLSTDTVTGAFGTKSGYNPAANIRKYLSEGYQVVSDGFPAGGIDFNNAGNVPTYRIAFKHQVTTDTVTSNPDKISGLSLTGTQTINYVYGANTGKQGQQAAPTKTTKITFTRIATYDHVTKQVTYGAWTSQATGYPAVVSPTITGYTPSAASSTAVTEKPAANATASDISNTQTITYNANQEKAVINYIDETTGKTLDSVSVSGAFGSTDKYDPSTLIKQYQAKGYVLVNNSVPTNGIQFNQDGKTLTYNVTFKHGTTTYGPSSTNLPQGVKVATSTTRVINYVYGTNQNGQIVAGTQTAAPTVTDTAKYERTVTVDNVTGAQTASAWKLVSGDVTFPAVKSPTITGYTANVANEPVMNATPDGQTHTETVIYTPNQEKATVTYIDDTTGKTLKVDTVTGNFNSDSSYNPQTVIDQYQKQGYQLVSDNWPTNGAVFNKDGVVQNYEVHLKEGTQDFDPTNNPDNLDLKHTVTQTIHYVYSDGKQAAPDATASITFNRTAVKDEVTGKITYSAWQATGNTDDFPAVKSPVITGYTPSAVSSTAITNVTGDSANNVQTITYTPNKETATVKYVDQTTGKTLQTVTVSGVYNGTIAYDANSVIQGYEKQGYVLVNNGVPANGITFNKDGVTPTYTVTLKHGTTTYTSTNNPENLDLSNTVTHTIHYVYSKGGQAQPDNVQKLTFTRTATKDNVTGTITYGNWGPASGTFNSVTTPSITGYTPSATSSAQVTGITASSADSSQTITYTPDQESATVTFIDQTTDKVIKNVILTGGFNSTSNYSPASEIAALEKAGYQLVSNNYPATGVKFDEAGQAQHFTITLKHTYTTETPTSNPDGLNLTHDVVETINYVYANGKQAAPTKTTTIAFTRTATKDNVTGKIIGYSAWQTNGNDSFPAVVSPQITGYTPDKSSVAAVYHLTGQSPDVTTTVTYTADQEKAVVQYIDDTTGKVIATDNLSGAYGTDSSYQPENEIKKYEQAGYQFVSSDYPQDGNVFDQNGKVQTYQIHLKETTTTFTPNNNPQSLDLTDTVIQTIKYQFTDGKQAASTKKASITFTRDAIKNNVTGAITYTPWTPAISNFPQVTSPEITGYTPSQKQSSAVAVQPGDKDNVQVITYAPNQEKATVTFIDQTTGKTLQVVDLSGAYGTVSSYQPTATIQKYEAEGYVLVKNGYPQGGASFDEDGTVNNYNIYLKHQDDQNPAGLDLDQTVTETINYVYANGKQAAASKVLTLHFHRDAQKDAVTGAVTYTPWQAVDGTSFDAVKSPVITGYTANKPVVQAVDGVSDKTPDRTITVTYTPNQKQATVTFVDDTANKVISKVNLNGAFGTTSTYSPAATIKQLEAKGYEVVSDDFPTNGIEFDQAGKVQNFTIHLKHKTTINTVDNNPDNVAGLTHEVTRTINYRYQNGQTAAKSVVQSVTFTRTATKDQVTGQITYSPWARSRDVAFAAVQSPEIAGYTPSEKVVSAVATVNADTQNMVENVIYTPNEEQATVSFIDDTTGKVLSTTTLSGAYDTDSDYQPDQTIKRYESKGYELVSNDYPQDGNIFNQAGKVQHFEIHLKHRITTDTATSNPDKLLNLQHTVTRTINYRFQNGKTADPSVVQQIVFSRSATFDHVTGQITYSKWKASANDAFSKVISPTIKGYTPNKAAIQALKNVAESASNITQVVTYSDNQESATITYVDDTTGKAIQTVTVNGDFGTKADYDESAVLKNYEKKGYQYVSGNYPANGITFDVSGVVKHYVVHLKETINNYTPDNNPKKLDLTKTVTRTINYVDANGKQLAPSVTQTITFTRNATVNEVTGQVTYTDWQPSGSDSYDAVESPTVKGYTPTQKTVKAENNVSVNSTDQVVNVVYTADKPATPEHKPSGPDKKPVTPEHKPSEPDKKPATPEHKPSEPDKKPATPEHKPSEPNKKPATPEHKPSEPDKKPATPEHKPSEPDKKPTTPEHKPNEPDKKPATPEHKPSEPDKKPATPEYKPSEPDKKPATPEHKPSEPDKKPVTPEHKPSEPNKKPATSEHKPSEPTKKPTVPEHKPSEPAKKPQASVAKPTEHVQPSKKPVQTTKPAAGQSLKVETVKKAVSTKQASSANDGTVRVAEQSTTIEKQTPNNSAAQPNESKNTLPQTGEDSTNHSLFGELLLALSGLLGLFGIGKRKKDKEE